MQEPVDGLVRVVPTVTPDLDPNRGVYGISVAAELVHLPVQSLRLYEARGLLQPARSGGGTRLYSANDLERLRHIGDLIAAGVNLAGVSVVLGLESENADLRAGRKHRPAAARSSSVDTDSARYPAV
jgi:MerR family transcriptional regulator/heat shock protein HspR